MRLFNTSEVKIFKFFWPIIFIISYIFICINFLQYSLDLQTHLGITDLYQSGVVSTTNNFISLLINSFTNISSEKIIYNSYILAIIIWPISLFIISRSSVTYFLLWSTIIPLINLNRQFIALAFGILLFKLFKLIKLKNQIFIAFLISSFFHLSSIFLNTIIIFKNLKIKKYILLLIIIFIIICYVLPPLRLLPRFLVMSSNPSGIQGNYIPSLLILFTVSFCLNGKSLLIMNILNSLFIFILFINLNSLNNFNQFIYLSRYAWSQLFAECIYFLIQSHNKSDLNIDRILLYWSNKNFILLTPIANISLFILGTYFTFFMTKIPLI